MKEIARYFGQAVVYVLIMVVVGTFADTPAYQAFPDDQGFIRLTLSHGGRPRGGCRKQSAKELSKIAPNMRRKKLCSRERLPVLVKMTVDGKPVLSRLLQPTGIRNDGPVRLYEGVPVAAGRHEIALALRDSDRKEGFDYERKAVVDIRPGQNFVIQFRTEFGGFDLK